MGRIVNFQSRPVSPLWKPSKRTRPAWRLLSCPSVVPFRLPSAPEAVQAEQVRVAPKRAAHSDIVRELEREVERIVDVEDGFFEERLDDYSDCIDESEVLRNFLDNYSSGSIGIKELDDLSAEDILELARTRLGGDQKVVDLILECSEAEASDYYVKWNEVASVPIGEMEYQIDVSDHADLEALIAQATDEELSAAGINDRDSFMGYGRPCERVIWKLDAEMLLERLSDSYTTTHARA